MSDLKRLAGVAALNAEVRDGMCVGLGSGSTVEAMVEELGCRVRAGLNVTTVATSVRTENFARELGIHVVSLDHADTIDVVIDGADEIVLDDFSMIKGGGGCLLWEKIVAKASKKMVAIVDESKCVSQLGAFPLPIEVVSFGKNTTKKIIENYFSKINGQWRKLDDGSDFVTDSGHFILDVDCSRDGIFEPAIAERYLNSIPGVVENGLFCAIAKNVFVGFSGGKNQAPYVLQGEDAISVFNSFRTT